MVLEIVQTHDGQHLARMLFVISRLESLSLGPEDDVFPNSQPGKQRRLLEHHTAIRTGYFHGLAANGERAGCDFFKAGDGIEQC